MTATLVYATDGLEAAHIRAVDPVLGGLIDRIGPFEQELREDRFTALARAIVGQQLSVSAANSIWSRFATLCDGVDAPSVRALDVPRMRAIGLSNAKAAYVLDLAVRELDGSLALGRLDELEDEDVIADLTQVKGIGRWTAEMFLIFSLGRPDVFAVDDVGLRRACRWLYGVADLDAMVAHADAWRPYRSAGSLYLWEAINRGLVNATSGV